MGLVGSDYDLELEEKEDSSTYEDSIIQTYKKELRIFTINIDDEIEAPDKYRKVFSLLDTAKESDIIKFKINSDGGLVDTTIQFIESLRHTKAKTIAEVYRAYSSASIIALACDEIITFRYSTMMIHSISFGEIGKIYEVKERTEFLNKLAENLFEELYKGFLKDKEIERILKKGKDFWFCANEIDTRLKKWVPIRKRKVKE